MTLNLNPATRRSLVAGFRFNFFPNDDQQIFLTIARGEFNILGFQDKNLLVTLMEKTASQRCRVMKRLSVHGLIRKIAHSYKLPSNHSGT
ncbi:MAG: hypothetical protein AYP45_18040 [Candidatus Brocadia carolinensis]|uniref:Uncharacterized protein n=1 Tax=Candidatus Brocadia carolinensis TaxID=1004156 RepID=A0A1V4AP43_9BACT|nr:MAG: hypothetical protein AYP45_18040 [Candidatus Brocadia caroliniensis]